MAWFPCCSGETPPCARCTSDSDTVSITLQYITGAGCTQCTQFNATWVLTRRELDICTWDRQGTIDCVGFYNKLHYTMTAHAGVDVGGNYVWFVNLYYRHDTWPLLSPNEEYKWKWDSGGSSAFDCTAQRTATFTSYYSPYYPGSHKCTYVSTPACTIN